MVGLRFQIETGYTVVPYQDCEKFGYSENLHLAAEKDPTQWIVFISLMWLWNCRNHRWEFASKWKDNIAHYVEAQFKHHDHLPFATMYLLEGYLLSLVHSINSQSITALKVLETIINKLFRRLQTSAKFSKFIIPRLKHFRAYYEYIKGHEEKALKMLEDTLVSAAKYENALELVHINHSKLAWNNQLSRAAKDRWITHCDPDHHLDFRLLEGFENKIISYTLPKPNFD